MRIVKLAAALGLAGVVFSAAGSSSAGGPVSTLLGVAPDHSAVAANNHIELNVTGVGKCMNRTKIIDPNGVETVQGIQSLDPPSYPFKAGFTPKIPGKHTVIIFTEASAYAKSCAAGQSVQTTVDVFAEPLCPPNWQKTYFDKYTGAISCVPKTPVLSCKGKTAPFYTPAEGVCQAGCSPVIY